MTENTAQHRWEDRGYRQRICVAHDGQIVGRVKCGYESSAEWGAHAHGKFLGEYTSEEAAKYAVLAALLQGDSK